MTEFTQEAGERLAKIIRLPHLDTRRASDVAHAILDRPTKIGDTSFRDAFIEVINFNTLESLRSASNTNQLIEIARQIESQFFVNYSVDLQKSLRETLRILIVSSRKPEYFSTPGSPSKGASPSKFENQVRNESESKRLVSSSTDYSKPASSTSTKVEQVNVQPTKAQSKRFALAVTALACFVVGFCTGLIKNNSAIGLAAIFIIAGSPIFVFNYLKSMDSRVARIAFSLLGTVLGFTVFIVGGGIGTAVSGAS